MVGEILQGFADRGVFRGFSQSASRSGRATFKLLWHRDRLFELTFDQTKGTLRLPAVLPKVDAAMFRDLKQFVASRQSKEAPEHRRIDPDRARIRCTLKGGDAAIAITSSDVDYATRKLVNLVHEIYMVFLYEPRYYDYLIETFDLDPDRAG